MDQAPAPFTVPQIPTRCLWKSWACICRAALSFHPTPPCAKRLHAPPRNAPCRSEENTSELQQLMRHSYAVFSLKKKQNHTQLPNTHHTTCSKTLRLLLP